MHAVVLDISEQKAVVLREDGCVSVVKNNRYTIGQRIIITRNKVLQFGSFALIAASFIICAFFAAGFLNTTENLTNSMASRPLAIQKSINEESYAYSEETEYVEIMDEGVPLGTANFNQNKPDYTWAAVGGVLAVAGVFAGGIYFKKRSGKNNLKR